MRPALSQIPVKAKHTNGLRLIITIWMAENLNYDQSAYNNDPTNCETYGRLYNWAAVMQGESSSNSNPSGV